MSEASSPLNDATRLARHFGWQGPLRRKRDSIPWLRNTPFLLFQLTPLLIFVVGFSWIALAVAFAFWALRMFAITGFYHRYFSHKSFRAGRFMQLVMAVWGSLALQKGALWWAAHHRDHHRYSDQPEDIHSPVVHGFLWSHMGWILSRFAKPVHYEKVKELARYRELRVVDRFHWVAPILSAFGMYWLGVGISGWAPSWGTSGGQMLVWGFFVSTFVLYHTTYTINSFTHRFGTRRYETRDESRNHWFFALITLGEGWHNNHHHYPSSARMGFFWYEFDPTYWGLWLMSRLGWISDLRPVPDAVRRPGGAKA